RETFHLDVDSPITVTNESFRLGVLASTDRKNFGSASSKIFFSLCKLKLAAFSFPSSALRLGNSEKLASTIASSPTASGKYRWLTKARWKVPLTTTNMAHTRTRIVI